MAGAPRRSPSSVLIDTPSARDSAISAATEGWRSPDSSRERWAVDSSARWASCSSVRPARVRSSRRLSAMEVRASLELHRLIVGRTCLRGKRICQSSRVGNIRETATRSIGCRRVGSGGDQGGEPVKDQVTPGAQCLERARVVAWRMAAALLPGPMAASAAKTLRKPSTGGVRDLQVELQTPGRLADPEGLVGDSGRCSARCAHRAAGRRCRRASAAR